MTWNPGTDRPPHAEVALIAVRPIGMRDTIALPELYRYDLAEARWMSLSGGLLLKHAAFAWCPVRELLPALP